MREEKRLTVENAKLKNDIEELKKQLLEREKRRGGTLTFAPTDSLFVACCSVLLINTISSISSILYWQRFHRCLRADLLHEGFCRNDIGLEVKVEMFRNVFQHTGDNVVPLNTHLIA